MPVCVCVFLFGEGLERDPEEYLTKVSLAHKTSNPGASPQTEGSQTPERMRTIFKSSLFVLSAETTESN